VIQIEKSVSQPNRNDATDFSIITLVFRGAVHFSGATTGFS
jgi:hypothetical protein